MLSGESCRLRSDRAGVELRKLLGLFLEFVILIRRGFHLFANLLATCRCHVVKARAFRYVLANQTIGILIETRFPAMVWMSKIARHIRLFGNYFTNANS